MLTGSRLRPVGWSTVISAAGYLLLSLLNGWREVIPATLKVGLHKNANRLFIACRLVNLNMMRRWLMLVT